jgi:hypothetical protein
MFKRVCLFVLVISFSFACTIDNSESVKIKSTSTVSDTIFTVINESKFKLEVFFDSALVEEWTEVNGLREGMRLKYHSNGVNIMRGMYVKGVRIGKFGFFDRNGDLEKICHYVPFPEREGGERIFNYTRLNYQISFTKDNNVDSLRSFYYMVRSRKDTFRLGEKAVIDLEYKVTHGGDSNWFETGPYVFPLYQYLSEKKLEVSSFDTSGVINLEIETNELGANVFAGVIYDYNTKTDSLTEMYVQYRYYVEESR